MHDKKKLFYWKFWNCKFYNLFILKSIWVWKNDVLNKIMIKNKMSYVFDKNLNQYCFQLDLKTYKFSVSIVLGR